MYFALLSFVAGFLTVLAPCSLFLLPTILLGSTGSKDPLRPWLVVGSLGISVFLFTLIIKGTSLAFVISEQAWALFSGILLVLFGFTSLFPRKWEILAAALKLTQSQNLLSKSSQHQGKWGAVLVGASLGPVFSTCSPTFAILLATILPVNFAEGAFNIALFVLGMILPFLMLGWGGQRILSKFKFFANPDGFFKKMLGALLIFLGLMVATGLQKSIEAKFIERGYFGPIGIEQALMKN